MVNVLDSIKDDIHNEYCEMHHNSVVTGLIKGSGIAKLHLDKNGNYGVNESKRARDCYKKSTRVYKVYGNFTKPLALVKIFGAKKVSAYKLLNYGKEEKFEGLVKKIKDEVKSCAEYNYDFDLSQFVENFKFINVSDDIRSEVLKYVKLPSTDINIQRTCNLQLEKSINKIK